MGLITFVIEIIIAYFLGMILFYVVVFFLGTILEIGERIYFSFKWIIAHFLEITASIGIIIAIIYLILFIKRKRIIPRSYQAVKSRLFIIGKIINKVIKPVKEWNERYKPKDIKSIRKYGAISFLIGTIGAVVFYLNGLWYISLFYLFWIISGIYQRLYPQRALEEMNK